MPALSVPATAECIGNSYLASSVRANREIQTESKISKYHSPKGLPLKWNATKFGLFPSQPVDAGDAVGTDMCACVWAAELTIAPNLLTFW